MLVLISQNLVESCIFLNENHAHLRKKLQYLNFYFSISSPGDLILVSAACLAGWQTMLVCFFPRTVGSPEKKRHKWVEN